LDTFPAHIFAPHVERIPAVFLSSFIHRDRNAVQRARRLALRLSFVGGPGLRRGPILDQRDKGVNGAAAILGVASIVAGLAGF
jgi:hypothetical protein